MTAIQVQQLDHQELELEYRYTFDQINRLFNQLQSRKIGEGMKALLTRELYAYKASFAVITAEFERRYIP